MRVIACHTRRSIAACLFKPAGLLRRSCFAIFDRGGRSVDRSGRVSMAMDGDKSRISSRSVSARQRLKIGRCWPLGRRSLVRSKNSYIATLVERHTRYVMLAKVTNKDTQTVVSALIKQAKKLPNELYKSLTWDRGKELTDHDDLRWQPTSTSTSAIRKAPGSAVPTRTPTACCDSTSPRAPISRLPGRAEQSGAAAQRAAP